LSGGQNSRSSFYGGLFCTIIIILSSIVLQIRDSPPLVDYQSKSIAKTKPYSTFDEFFPHYLREHSQLTTRQWHYLGTSLFIIYTIFNPTLALPIIAGFLSGSALIPFVRHLSTGFIEGGTMLLIYLIGARLLTRSFVTTFVPLLISYGFAWVGHFFYEYNKPATFIYPTYSLLGDFRMIFEAIRGQFGI